MMSGNPSRVKIAIRQWRMSSAEPSGLHMWFDPTREELVLYRRTEPYDAHASSSLREIRGTPSVGEGSPYGGSDPEEPNVELELKDSLPF